MDRGKTGVCTRARSASSKGTLLPVCVVCEETPPLGIVGGIVVSGRFLCSRCEKEIVHLRVGDSHYALFREKIKKLWGKRD